jgi:hypothetical protein
LRGRDIDRIDFGLVPNLHQPAGNLDELLSDRE